MAEWKVLAVIELEVLAVVAEAGRDRIRRPEFLSAHPEEADVEPSSGTRRNTFDQLSSARSASLMCLRRRGQLFSSERFHLVKLPLVGALTPDRVISVLLAACDVRSGCLQVPTVVCADPRRPARRARIASDGSGRVSAVE